MKRIILATLAVFCAVATQAKNYTVSTPNSMMVFTADAGEPLYFRYYGIKASLQDVFSSHRAMKEEAFRSFGAHCTQPSAVIVKHCDGDMATHLVFEDVYQTQTEKTSLICFTMRDKAHPGFSVKLCYEAYKDCDVIKCWAEYINNEKKAITLQKYMSAMLPVASQDCALMHLNGDHGNECWENAEPLGEGLKVIQTMEGSRNSHVSQAAFMLGTDGPQLSETQGNVIGGVLSWTGNFQIEFYNSRLENQPVQIIAGINPTAADYTLDTKKSLRTPEMILTYSTQGKGQVSRNIHYWARNYQVLGGTLQREILLNSWEGVHLAVKQDEMNQMMEDFAEIGGELFVMDDGWFGNKYVRDTDDRALGDWYTAKGKLPQGVQALVDFARSKGLKFGIWIEPEMVNTRSELYEQHPDWVLRSPEVEPTVGRGKTQLLLDLTNPKVQDFVFSVVDNIMKETPDIYYIKWDHNMSINNASSLYLPKARQSNLYVDYQLGLEKILKRVRAAYPNLIIQLCSSGGERLNYGYMPYFQEVWTSDQTDPLQRILIQWGSLDFYPSNILAAHVCAAQNKYTQRLTPIKYRFDVASMCRLGMEMVPGQMTQAEKEYAKRAIASYKKLRPVIQQGDLYKLVSPYEGDRNYASLMYVNPQKSNAVVFMYRQTFLRHMPDKIIKLQGLDPEKNYLIREACPEDESAPLTIDGKVVSGKYLMTEGIILREFTKTFSRKKQLSPTRNISDYRSYVLELIAQ